MMTFPKLLFYLAIVLFGLIGLGILFKSPDTHEVTILTTFASDPIEIELDQPLRENKELSLPENLLHLTKKTENVTLKVESSPEVVKETPPEEAPKIAKKTSKTQEPPEANRIEEFFNLTDPKFPIVETITYKSRVSWQKGRPAWLSDYANHYKTSRHFIARSLNGKPDYLKQDLGEGARFNILNPEKNIHFNLIIDISRCKMWFYYHDLNTKEKVLVKTYPVGLGRIDHSKISGYLTPLGVYSLGSRIAVYTPKMMGTHNGAKVEMMRVFGTRWIPFEKEISATTAPAKGFGIHGLPWTLKNGSLMEDMASLGKYESDGCVRMSTADIEELYAIIITRPTTVEIVKDFFDAENKFQTTADIANK